MVAKTVNFPVIYIKHRGNFSFEGICRDIQSWFVENSYDFYAPKHKHKGVEAEINFKGERKITGYIKFIINVKIRIWDLKDVEIIQDGEKTKMQSGRVAIDVVPGYVLDYEKRFKDSKFLKAVQVFYHKYIIKRKLEDYWEDELFLQANGLIAVIKKALFYEAM